ncbi:MAG: C4-type zinc ribbon domain-containing protein [Actinomycetota bacterium]|nr:C4-type zinc ribbon domain-containing protein [Actinomycetota bacterium]
MKAEHSAQLRLLDLQAADTALAQLAHRRRTLPELAALAERDERADALTNAVIDAETALGDTAGGQRRLENEVDSVRARAARDEQRLGSGGVPAKELAGLQHEITSLARRQSNLEDELLEVMEQREESELGLTTLTTQRDALRAEQAELSAARDNAFAEIDAATAERGAERASIATELPSDLIAVYERAREHGGGVGAAVLRQRRCEGCRIELPGTELSSVRTAAEDEVIRCDNCRRILVRTDESGL